MIYFCVIEILSALNSRDSTNQGVVSRLLCRNQAEMVHTCRGTISLHGAIIHTEDSCTFVISNGSTQTFHIKAANEVERQRWVTTLELAKAKAIRAMESGKNLFCAVGFFSN
jgi:hypothetical protein